MTSKILKLIDEGHAPSKIAWILHSKPNKITYYLKRMLEINWITPLNTYPKTFIITEEGKRFQTSSLYVKVKTNRVEHYQLKFPLIKDNPQAVFDYEKEVNNWIKKYFIVNLPFNLTIEKTPRNIIVHVHQKEFVRDKLFLSELVAYTTKIILFVAQFLRNKGIIVDISRFDVISQEIETKEPGYDKAVEPSSKIVVDLQRNASTVSGKAEFPAVAWTDRSAKVLEIGTNDLLYSEKLILMPEKVFDLGNKFNEIINEIKTDNIIFKEFLSGISETTRLNSIALKMILERNDKK